MVIDTSQGGYRYLSEWLSLPLRVAIITSQGGYRYLLEWLSLPLRVAIVTSQGGYRYLSVEPYLEGQFTKFNGNNGFVRKDNKRSRAFETAQAFTHWSYEHTLRTTGQAVMVCDIQGVGFKYTDATVCSEDRRFGKTDLGEAGFAEFFRTHRCNTLCEALELTPVTNGETADASSSGASRNTATSAIEIIRSKHLAQRKREREIETRAMQAAVKHGRKEAGNVGGRIKHVHNGLAVVTDAEARVGITAYPIHFTPWGSHAEQPARDNPTGENC